MVAPMFRWKLLLVVGVAVIGSAVALGMILFGPSSSSLEPPRRDGAPALVVHAGRPGLWVLTKQEEVRHVGTRRSGTIYHFDLRNHDPETGAVAWRRRLHSVADRDGGHSAQARILGQDGDVVWLFVVDQPIAVSPVDATPIADRAKLEEATPALRGWLPRELQFYAFHDGLIATTADARRVRVRAPGYAAFPYRPVSEDAFRRLSFMASQWNGGYRTSEFLVRSGLADGRWIGILSETEAVDASEDGFGDKFRDATRIADEGAQARRALMTATIARTRAFSEDRQDRLSEVRRLPDLPFEYLQGGFLVEAGKRSPLAVEPPGGFVVVHRTRIDADGQVALTRLDRGFAPLWTATLPIEEILNRWQLPGQLLIYGSVTQSKPGDVRYQEFVVNVSLADGRVRGWNVTLESPLAP